MGKRGQCHICGNVAELTYEHVPPRAAFNRDKEFMYKGKQAFGREKFPWDLSGLRGKQHQRGIGFHTLCGPCNNYTGTKYARAFVEFTKQGYDMVGYNTENISAKQVRMRFRIHPLKVIKQIISMFLSINTPNLSTVHEDLRAFVLGADRRDLPRQGYGVYLYLLKGNIARYIGMAGILSLEHGQSRVLSELAAPPFGYVLEFKPKVTDRYCDITFFGNEFVYDDEREITLNIPVYESNTYFPADYRTKQQVLGDYIQNTLYEKTIKAQT